MIFTWPNVSAFILGKYSLTYLNCYKVQNHFTPNVTRGTSIFSKVSILLFGKPSTVVTFGRAPKKINNDGTLSSFYYSLLLFSLQTRAYDNNVFAIWIEMLQSIEEKASNYYTQLQELEKEILKDLKKLKANKTKRMKNFNDRVSTLQKELEYSVTEVRTNLQL